MNSNHEEPGHGNTVAAWSAVIVAILGVTLATFGYLFSSSLLLVSGGIVTVISIALGPVLAKFGFGAAGKNAK